MTNHRQAPFGPSYGRSLAPFWQSPISPNRTPVYNNGPSGNSPSYNAAPEFQPQEFRTPSTPQSGPFFDSVPPLLPSQADSTPTIPKGMEGIAQLTVADQQAALRQRTCPVNGEPLGSMGKPIRVNVAGRTLFVCCEGCVNPLRSNPAKYLTSVRQPSVTYLR